MSNDSPSVDHVNVPTKLEIAGLVLCALTFVIQLSQSSVRTTNGRVVASCTPIMARLSVE